MNSKDRPTISKMVEALDSELTQSLALAQELITRLAPTMYDLGPKPTPPEGVSQTLPPTIASMVGVLSKAATLNSVFRRILEELAM